MSVPKPTEPTAEQFNMANEKLLDRQDLLQLFHISVRTLQYWRSEGILPYFKIGNKIFYRQKDVEELIMKNRFVKTKK